MLAGIRNFVRIIPPSYELLLEAAFMATALMVR